MKRIKIEDASEGDILAKNIVLENGIILLSEKSILTELTIGQIKKRHIHYAYIENNTGMPEANTSHLKNETIKNNLSDIEERFILVKDIKLMEDIKNIVKEVIITGYSD
ncbi:MAG: hypothetical protein ACYCT7_05475 [bacterium]